MNRLRKNSRTKNLILSVVTILPILSIMTTPIKAEIVEKDIKGLYAILKPQYGYLSPIHGLAIHRNGILPNIRFHGNYGAENQNYKCHAQLNPQQRQLDCPQDDMTVLIQQVFPAPGGGQLVPNNYDNLIKNLKLRTIGAILRHITLKDLQGVSQLALVTFQNQEPETYRQFVNEILSISSAQEKKSRKNKQINSPEQKRIGEIAQQVAALKKQSKTLETEETIKNLLSEKERLQQILAQEKQNIQEQRPLTSDEQNLLYDKFSKTKDFQQYIAFSTDIVNALQVQKDFPNDYPPLLVEQALLAFAVKKDTTTKNDFIGFFEALGSEFLNPQFVQNKKIVPPQNWNSQYTPEDYILFKEAFQDNKPSPEILTNTLQNPEDMLYYTLAYDIYDQAYPRTLDFSKAMFPAPQKEEVLTLEQMEVRKYPDCGEMSLRNFFNVMLYDVTKRAFDIDVLKQMAPNADPSLFEFFQHQKPDNLEDMRHVWSDIVSNVERGEEKLPIKYSKKRTEGQCDITPSLINLLRVAVHLLNDEKLNEIEVSDKIDTEKSVAILTRLCEMITDARKDFNVTWQVQGQDGGQKINDDTGVVIEFIINYKPEFSWSFTTGHFDFQRLPSGIQRDWRKASGQSLFTYFSQPVEKMPLGASQLAYGSNLLPFYTTPDTAKALLSTLPIPLQSHLFSPILFSFPTDTGGTLKAIDLVLGYQKKQIQSPGPLLATALSSWIPKLPNDPEAIVPLFDVLEPFIDSLPKQFIDFLWSKIKVNLETVVVEASKKGWIHVMDLIIQKDPNAILRTFKWKGNNSITYHYSPLFLAIVHKQKFMVEFLLEHAPKLLGEDLIWLKPYMFTPLHLAAQINADIVQIILDRAPQLLEEQYIQNRDGNTPLNIAVDKGHKDIVKLLLEKTLKMYKRNLFLLNNDKQGPLHIGYKTDLDIYKMILGDVPSDLKESLFLADVDGNTPLNSMKSRPSKEFIQLILNEVPPKDRQGLFLPNKLGQTALMCAIFMNNFSVIPLLMKETPPELQQSILQKGYNNGTLLHEAARENALELAQVLLEQAPNLAYEKNDSGYTPLHIAAWKGNTKMMELLLKAAPQLLEEVYVKDSTGKTPLHWAAQGNNEDAVKLLLMKIQENPKLKETLFSADNDGNTPLMLTKNDGIKVLLREAGEEK